MFLKALISDCHFFLKEENWNFLEDGLCLCFWLVLETTSKREFLIQNCSQNLWKVKILNPLLCLSTSTRLKTSGLKSSSKSLSLQDLLWVFGLRSLSRDYCLNYHWVKIIKFYNSTKNTGVWTRWFNKPFLISTNFMARFELVFVLTGTSPCPRGFILKPTERASVPLKNPGFPKLTSVWDIGMFLHDNHGKFPLSSIL